MVQGVTEHEILVANSAAVTGVFATTGNPIVAGIRAYLDMVNASGGIDGRTIRLLHQDDGYNADNARSIMRRFLQEERVFAIVGHFGSPVVQATLDDIRKTGIPAVYFATGMGELYAESAHTFAQGANCYPIQPLYITEGRVLAVRAATTFRAKRLGVLYTDDSTGNDILQGVQLSCHRLGIPYIHHKIPISMEGLSDAVRAIGEGKVDMVILAAAQAFVPALAGELAAQRMRLPAITTYLNAVITVAQQLQAAVGGRFPIYAPNWLAYDGKRLDNLEVASAWLGDYAMNGYAHCGWIGAHYLCEGLRRLAGREISWEAFREAMESAPIENPFGGTIDYAGGNRMGTQEMSLTRLDLSAPIGWLEIDRLRSIEELLEA